jgi:xanthine dehydrogenase accessory factor
MKEINLWQFIKSYIEKDEAIVLMVVVESENSSPGRAGFKMAVSKNKEMTGSIGGGIMEHNLVEHAAASLNDNTKILSIKKLYHVGDSRKDSSGMICSGAQTIFTLTLRKDNLLTVEKIIDAILHHKIAAVRFDPKGMYYLESDLKEKRIVFNYQDEQNWTYQENLSQLDTIFIIGGGHVGLALSKVMSFLNFYIILIDNRMNLQTIELNQYADEKIIINYDEIDKYLIDGDHSYVAIVSHTYKTDKYILQKVINRNFRYVGMMGSKAKVKEVLREMKELGFTKEQIKIIHAPIGLEITSETPEEIAISIAAEIIKIRNS